MRFIISFHIVLYIKCLNRKYILLENLPNVHKSDRYVIFSHSINWTLYDLHLLFRLVHACKACWLSLILSFIYWTVRYWLKEKGGVGHKYRSTWHLFISVHLMSCLVSHINFTFFALSDSSLGRKYVVVFSHLTTAVYKTGKVLIDLSHIWADIFYSYFYMQANLGDWQKVTS